MYTKVNQSEQKNSLRESGESKMKKLGKLLMATVLFLSIFMFVVNCTGVPESEKEGETGVENTEEQEVGNQEQVDGSGGENDMSETQAAVNVNGAALSQSEIDELKNTYRVIPQSGDYWYDAMSGLYGVIGYPAYGFMLSGHDFGIVSRDDSNGDTGVLINGRELPESELQIWSQMLGYWILPGSYWLDSDGNAGYEGDPTVLVNLANMASQNSYSGSGGNDDNFWSTRFSAGNHDSSQGVGYVSVPGYGPVGYGF